MPTNTSRPIPVVLSHAPADIPEHVWDAVLAVATAEACYEAAAAGGFDVATLVGQAVEATVAAMRKAVR